jgi:hypothetical protein
MFGGNQGLENSFLTCNRLVAYYARHE